MRKEIATYFSGCLFVAVLLSPLSANPQGTAQQSAVDDSKVRPPVTKADLQIVKRARELLDSPLKWNRADNRVCPAQAKTISLYCALQMATIEVGARLNIVALLSRKHGSSSMKSRQTAITNTG